MSNRILCSQFYSCALHVAEPGCDAMCLAVCPHDHRYFLVGGGDGVVRLHSTEIDHPLTSWQSSPDSSPIVGLQWSPARPCVFYVLDSNGRLVLLLRLS